MNRSTAREIAIQLCFAGANGKLSADELLDSFFAEEHYASLAAEDELYSEYPDDKQMDYIRRLVKLIDENRNEFDGFIERYSHGWKVDRISKTAARSPALRLLRDNLYGRYPRLRCDKRSGGA